MNTEDVCVYIYIEIITLSEVKERQIAYESYDQPR